MEIYIVVKGDTIESIASKYGLSAEAIIQSNELTDPDKLVPGQTIVITHPTQTYIVKEGDTLAGIASSFGVTIMQLLRNNPYLSSRDYIYPGETLIISYGTSSKIVTNGYAFAYINRDTLVKTLPYLTYLTVNNYVVTSGGEINAVYDDTDLIQTAKDYGVVPLMLTTTLSLQGEKNVQTSYNILVSDEFQDNEINNALNIIKAKGYLGININIDYLNATNQQFYINFIQRYATRIHNEGYYFLLTINPSFTETEGELSFEKVDFSEIGKDSDQIVFMDYVWGSNYGPPGPVSSIKNTRAYLDYVTTMISPDRIIIGQPVMGYDWALPYDPGKTIGVSLTYNSVLDLSRANDVAIQFDEVSQTPYFNYFQSSPNIPVQHIVWFIDARSADAILKVSTEYGLTGVGIWNIMMFFAQPWLVTISQYSIIKILPEI